jgi:anti-sigma factor RsiW
MTLKADRGERLHRRVWDLLPWYANGTLESGEQRIVESHLDACARCREELAAVRRIGEVLRQIPEIAPAPHPAHFARLMERIDKAESAGGRRAAWTALRGFLAATPRAVRWTLAAQLGLVLLLAAGLLLRSPAPPPAVYQTLSDPEPAVSAASAASAKTGVRLRLVFAPGTTEQEIRNLLLGIRGQITAGPSSFGVYTVEVPAGPDPLAGVLAHLRRQKQVSLAEPVAP